MDNYILFILIIALTGAVLDCVAEKNTTLQHQLYRFFFVAIYTLFLIRYYYGPDISTYVPHFEQIAPPRYLIDHPAEMAFEPGYEMLCSCVKALGSSYWWLTAVITTLYFLAIACLLHRLDRHRLFALACIVLFDYNLIYAQSRQCLAVAFFIFMVLCLQDKRYMLAILMGLLTMSFHKSGFVPICATLIGLPLWNMRHNADIFKLLLILLLVLFLIPVSRMSTSMLSALPIPEAYIDSVRHHVLLGKQVQLIGIVYFALLILIIHLHRPRFKYYYGWLVIESVMGLALIVALYQYYYLLIRLRSFFLPVMVWYVISLVNHEAQLRQIPYSTLARQITASLLILYFTHSAIRYHQMVQAWHSPIARACTLFDLHNATPKQIRDRQLHFAEIYWQRDYRTGDQNKL